MSEEAGKVAIVVSHGSLARGLVSAMEAVLGPQPDVFSLSNTGQSPAALQAEIERLIAERAAGKDVYLVTDLRGGSCASTCLRTARVAGVRGVFYGANLTLLLEFMLHRDLPAEEFFPAVLAKARNAVDGLRVEEGATGEAGTAALRSGSDPERPADPGGPAPPGGGERRDPTAAGSRV
jgi:mannose/fructose-specific phosphotransferase system component IIA